MKKISKTLMSAVLVVMFAAGLSGCGGGGAGGGGVGGGVAGKVK